jgi:hypothetical protein
MANSKTYIPKPRSKKVAMNKIKNTKVGDDIHYYINGMEGRGIVVKMANEYLEIFKENGQLGTIHINDTFFVKDILINKQWDDMEDSERYDALMKIHAPSPRYITKTWSDMPEEIKVLLQKQMPGGAGSTYEKGETKDSETQDHDRTGFAQNTQYAKKETEDEYYKKFTHSGERKETRAAQEKEILGHYTSQSGTKGGRWAAEQAKKKQEEMAKKKKEEVEAKKKEPKKDPKMPKTAKEVKEYHNQDLPDSTGKFTRGGKFIPKDQRKKAFYEEWLEKKNPRPNPRSRHGFGTTQSEAGQEAQSNFSDSTASAAGALGMDFGTATKARPNPRTAHGGFGTTQSEEGQEVQANQRAATAGAASALGADFGTATPSSKSDVEHGKYSNPGGTPEVGVSTDTKVDVTTGTGYEERPHISVEEAGKLPRGTFNESGSELTVSGSQDSKDEPKFSQPHSQETVRKVGLPEQHPNTYGVRYGMKGGVKKVWCPEHQMWEETRKDWHE